MDSLLELINSDTGVEFPDAIWDENTQSNLFLIEEALRQTGADSTPPEEQRTPYDDELMRLIDAVPLEK